MRLRDPDRPRLKNGSRQLLSGGAVPTWYLGPGREEGWCRLMVFLLSSAPSSYRDFTVEIPEYDLQLHWALWEKDPEKCCENWFGYAGPRAAQAQAPPATSLPTAVPGSIEDLDL